MKKAGTIVGEMPMLRGQFRHIPTVDRSLTKTGAAADAKEVGDRLAEHEKMIRKGGSDLDATLTKEGYPADAKAVGDKFAEQYEAIDDLLPKNQGAANVGKILVVGTDGNLTLIDMPEGGASGDVIGVFDESNNILLTGNIAVGTYTLVFENTDGTYTGSGTLVVEENVPKPTNLADPTSTDWQEGYRLSLTSGSISAMAGHTTTNFIPCAQGNVLRVKGLTITETATDGGDSESPKIAVYDANKSRLLGAYGSMKTNSDQAYGLNVTIDGDISTYTVALTNDGNQLPITGIAYIRLDGFLVDGYTKDDVIITINEEIV